MKKMAYRIRDEFKWLMWALGISGWCQAARDTMHRTRDAEHTKG